ncbi:MAG: DUF2062 domain-containing protein [Oceanibaculum sp.]
MKLVVPMKRVGGHHPPEYTARAVGIGLAWAFTPLVGAQMITVLLTWIIAKRFKWEFSLIVAAAWTWITNVATLVPSYYLFYVTGEFFLGRGAQATDYDQFALQYESETAATATSWWDSVLGFADMMSSWGQSMLIGCIPYAIIFGLVGYKLSLIFVVRHRAAKKERQAQRRKRRLEAVKETVASTLDARGQSNYGALRNEQ